MTFKIALKLEVECSDIINRLRGGQMMCVKLTQRVTLGSKDSSLRNGSLDSIQQAAELEGSSNMLVEKDQAEIIEIDGTHSPLELSLALLTSELIGDTPHCRTRWFTHQQKPPLCSALLYHYLTSKCNVMISII
jgi:hypothetical protein